MENKELTWDSLSMDERAHWLSLKNAIACVCEEQEALRIVPLMIEHYESLHGLFLSSESDLVELGLSADAVRLVEAVKNICISYVEEGGGHLKRVYDTESARQLLVPHFSGLKHESVAVLLLNSRNQVMYNGMLSEGGVSLVPVYIRRLLELCIHYSAHSVILAHNHPGGLPLPSENDMASTAELENILQGIDVWMEDHLILCRDSFFSFRSSGMLRLMRSSNEREAFLRNQEIQELEKKLLSCIKKI